MLRRFDAGFGDAAVDDALEKATVEITSWTRQAAVRNDSYFSNHRACRDLAKAYSNVNIYEEKNHYLRNLYAQAATLLARRLPSLK